MNETSLSLERIAVVIFVIIAECFERPGEREKKRVCARGGQQRGEFSVRERAPRENALYLLLLSGRERG